jgi:hypothetical protein
MTLYHMFDAAFPPPTAYPGTQAAAGYIGGNTPHIWTLEEWLRFRHMRQLPIWVADLGADPAASGRFAAQAARGLGWKPFAAVRRAIVADMETSADGSWVNHFAEAVAAHGFVTWVYGSLSSVLRDPARDGYWVASWDGVPDVEPIPHVVAHQYAPNVPWEGGEVDLSVLAPEAWERLGRGPRRHVP